MRRKWTGPRCRLNVRGLWPPWYEWQGIPSSIGGQREHMVVVGVMMMVQPCVLRLHGNGSDHGEGRLLGLRLTSEEIGRL